jgi:hypothetical protein
MVDDESHAKRVNGEFRPGGHGDGDVRAAEEEDQILQLISLGAPLPEILNRLCIAIDVQIGNVVSLISLPDGEESYLRSITQSAMKLGLDVFSSVAILSRDKSLLGTLEIYGCDSRRPTPHESQLIGRAIQLAEIALQRHSEGDCCAGFGSRKDSGHGSCCNVHTIGVSTHSPTVLGLRQVEARLIAEWSAFVSDVGTSLASGLPVKSSPLAGPPGLHVVEAKGKPDLLPGFRRQVSGPQRPLHPTSKGKAAKSGPLNSGVIKIIALRLILVRGSMRWKGCFLSAVTSPSWTRRTAIWAQLPRRWLRPVRAWYWESLAWGDGCLNIVASIDWPRLKTSAYRWLRQPCDPTRWRLADLRLFEELVKFNHRKM